MKQVFLVSGDGQGPHGEYGVSFQGVCRDPRYALSLRSQTLGHWALTQ